ncbi:hypothetical protein CEXT_221091 [Caerostris extrusa]|uniref:Uncharacterized protein n=1 Tax=Caerostris extrusa TaxID=172846 RepID=A0AAV4MG47_CAEEX|nr:hypothetical protein CEXT_221091 [Caerostris extrusa]
MSSHAWMFPSFEMGFSLYSPRDWKGLHKKIHLWRREGQIDGRRHDIIETHFEYYIRIVLPGLMVQTNITLLSFDVVRNVQRKS